jgi:tryptophan synthase alpha subunit
MSAAPFGPWRAGRIVTECIYDMDGLVVAEVATDSYASREGTTEQRAALIAAAPELLAALRELYAHEGEIHVNGIGIESDSEALEAAKAAARAVLKKVAP